MTKLLPEPTLLRDHEGRPTHAVIGWDDWRRLADLAAVLLETDEAAAREDAFAARAFAARAFAARAFAEARAEGDGFRLPLEHLKAIRSGEHVVAVLRKWRGLDQAQLAQRIGSTANYVSQIESRARRGVRRAGDLARALDVPEALIKAHL